MNCNSLFCRIFYLYWTHWLFSLQLHVSPFFLYVLKVESQNVALRAAQHFLGQFLGNILDWDRCTFISRICYTYLLEILNHMNITKIWSNFAFCLTLDLFSDISKKENICLFTQIRIFLPESDTSPKNLILLDQHQTLQYIDPTEPESTFI